MKFYYNQSDQTSNIFTKFNQNPTLSKRDIGHKSGIDRRTHRQKKVCRSLQSTDNDDNVIYKVV